MFAGVKRSYDQINDPDSALLRSAASSRAASPLSRASSIPRTRQSLDSGSRQHSRCTHSDNDHITRTLTTNKAPNPGGFNTGAGSDGSARRNQYESDVSIILIGIRGSGKSSLAVLAATAYGRRLIDFERAFFERTGLPLASHRKVAGISEHHKRHRHILEEVLQDHRHGCVIVCSFTDLEQGAHLLRRFAENHPVIHVLRDVKGIHGAIKVWSEEKIAQLLAISGPLLRSCSNFEYFNKTEDGDLSHQNQAALVQSADENPQLKPGQISSLLPFLTLKRAERDFLKFLRLVLGDCRRIPIHQSAYPLSQIPVEKRVFTYAATVSATAVLAGNVDLDALQVGADAVELMYSCKAPGEAQDLPYFIGEAYSIIRRATILPLVVHVTCDTIENPTTRDFYLQYLQYCLRLTPEYLVVDLGLDDAVLSKFLQDRRNTKIVGLVSGIDRLPGGWDNPECMSTYRRADELHCDVLRMTAQATQTKQNLALQSFLHNATGACPDGPPMSAFNFGHAGRPSMCFNSILTPVTGTGQGSSSELLTARQATLALFSSFAFDAMQFSIIGADVDFSLSPAMHNAAYAASGMPHHYTTQSSKSLQVLRDLAKDHSFGGAAITQPYKIEVVGLLSSLSRDAKIIRAVNTVLPLRQSYGDHGPEDLDIVLSRNRSGPVMGLHGNNTDWIGIRACIRRGLSPINTVRPNSCGLVIGAGGMARAAVYTMIHMGVPNVFICNRTMSNAVRLAEYYNTLRVPDATDPARPTLDANLYKVHVISSLEDEWPEGYRQPTMIVSSVPASKTMDGSLEATFTLPTHWLNSPTGGVVVELTYKPLETSLVRQIRADFHRGWVVMNGLDMLPEQAFAQFELFTGRRAPRRLMREEVLRGYRSEKGLKN